MNLRLIHAVVILFSAALAVVFGLWCLDLYRRQDGTGALVACYFMHLISEKKLILAVLVLTAVFFAALLALPLLTHSNGFWIHP